MRGTGTTCTRKHPHLRGENQTSQRVESCALETSPPAWGKLRREQDVQAVRRNIPTCVGKTAFAEEEINESRKHPHLRGENFSARFAARSSFGNIPTCVGKTARFCLDCHSGYYILLKSKFLALSLRQGRAIFAYHPSLGIDLRLAEAQRDVPNDCGGRVIKGRLLPN